jgi:hypothetical protein
LNSQIWSSLREEFYLPNARKKIAIGLTAFAVYFSIASSLKYGYPYLPPVPPPGTVLELKRPFDRFLLEGGLASAAPAPSLDSEADTNGGVKSPYVVYEGNQPLGPAHIMHTEISKLGHGRFSHWKGIGFVISSSDGTNAASNGRKYWVVLPR